jgi:hypothetical protein
MAKNVKVGRSSVTGRFVPPSYVRTHPSTTTTDTVRKPSPKR